VGARAKALSACGQGLKTPEAHDGIVDDSTMTTTFHAM